LVSNPDVLTPTAYLSPEIFEYEEKTLVRIHIPPSSEVHTYKKIVYDRVDDADVKVTATGAIAQMYIRKQNIYTEKKIYPYVQENDLRLDLLPRLKQMAANRSNGSHLWQSMSNMEMLQSARLISDDKVTGEKGFNLAAIMLLGKDDVILDICPAYRTDALVRKANEDRHDDRLIVQTNLIESYDQLVGFAAKHLLDKFYLEEDARISLSGAISREMLVNTLMHREFTAAHYAKFVIERNRMYTENVNRAVTGEAITPDNFSPNPKNPIIAAFFRTIGLAEELGSGVRNLYRYVRRYSGKEPQLIDGDVFKIIVPLDDDYSFEAEDKAQIKAQIKRSGCALFEQEILTFFIANSQTTQLEIANATGKSRRTVQDAIFSLKEKGYLAREGSRKNGHWIVTSSEGEHK
jgi:ATP-dependent DNA helicase RecG